MNVLYLTYDGITDHIGRAQVAPYLIGLARRGYSISIISAEKPGREALIAEYEQIFRQSGIVWNYVTYRSRPRVLAQGITLWRLYSAAKQQLQVEDCTLLHCRDFIPMFAGLRLKRLFNVRLLFDFRNFWVDSRIESDPRFAYLYRYMKNWERTFVRSSDKIVCLSAAAAQVLSARYLRDVVDPIACFHVIPCCADFQHFDNARLSTQMIESARSRAGLLPTDFVLLYLGSLGPDYLLDHMLTAFQQLLRLRPAAKFLFVCNNGRETLMRSCQAKGIDPEQVRYVSADRNEVPTFLSLAGMSVLFYRQGLRSTGCSPTKLAELFACNVPVIVNTGVGDVDSMLSLERNGSMVVKDFAEDTLLDAISRVLAHRDNKPSNIRQNTRKTLDIKAGVERYAAVYAQLVETPFATIDRCAAPGRQKAIPH